MQADEMIKVVFKLDIFQTGRGIGVRRHHDFWTGNMHGWNYGYDTSQQDFSWVQIEHLAVEIRYVFTRQLDLVTDMIQ
jgi:hypothetical protein